MNRNLINIEKILTVLIFTVILISSSSISLTINKKTDLKDSKQENNCLSEASTGLAPNIIQKQNKNLILDNNKDRNLCNNIQQLSKPIGNTMWGYLVNSSHYDKGPCFFDIYDPFHINILSHQDFFLSGGTWVWACYGRWIACQYDNGALWEIDAETGEMEYIGGGGASLNGLTFDVINNKLYGASSTDLYEIDVDTGEQTYIGPFGDNVNLMIAIATDVDSNMYGWDLGDKLWAIDSDTGEASLIGPLNIDINYAQDGHFDYETGVLYLTAYTTTGQLYECNKVTGDCFLIGDFQNGAQITASVIPYDCPCVCHDIGVKSINKPESSCYAVTEIPMQVTVKNYKGNPEITNVNMNVVKYEDGSIIFEENFSGTFPPEGWTTDSWNQSYTNKAGGEIPEAMCDKYTQYNNSNYYDNYIMTPVLNFSNLKVAELKFKFKGDINYYNCFFYVRYRENLSSNWKDCTPWNNPIEKDFGPDVFKVKIFGDSYLGDEFQVKWEYKGHYSNFNYWWLDDVTITSFNCSEEYNETVEDIVIEAGYELDVDFPTWTPLDWQNPEYENTWQEYQVKACTLLDDNYPKNNCKEKTINLYFPWMHDVEITSIDSPSKDGPGKTYSVKATIKNVGQYPECCIPINISIGESVVLDTILSEESWDTVPPSGWTDEHKNYSSDYGWEKSNTSKSGGSSPEAKLTFYNALAENVMYSYAINTFNSSFYSINFLSYINHYSGQGLYTLKAGYSYDKKTWYSVWSKAPVSNGRYKVSTPFKAESDTTFIGFWVEGNPNYFNYWYLDNIKVEEIDILEIEYSDHMCQGPDIEPGESVTFDFDDWTPEALLNEISCTKDYLIQAGIDMEGDKKAGNNVKSEKFTLDYWHDVDIDIASPVLSREPEEWLGFCNDDAVDSLGLTNGGKFEYAIRLTPDELGPYEHFAITTVKRHHSYTIPFTMEGKVKIYEQGTPTSPGDLITSQPFSCYEADWHEIILDEPVYLTDYEDIWVSIEVTHAAGQEPAGCDGSLDYPGKGDFIYLSSWEEISIYGFSLDWNILVGIEPLYYWHRTYIQPGLQEIKGIATNFGTFPELNLTCWAEIYDYIDDPVNGTLLYEDNITNINLEEPLGGSKELVFDDFNFTREGIYVLFLDMPYENDDKYYNNNYRIVIYVDDTKPISSHELDPEIPDGDNSWYVSDVEVRLDAYDPWIFGVSSGVKEINYKIDNGTTQTIPGNCGIFIIDKDKEDIIIEYWAIDYVGNEETHHIFTIDMDQTAPSIDLIYTWENGPNPGKPPWNMIFTAYATDEISQMNRVRFLINNVEQDVVTGPGPEYNWSFLYYGGLYLEIFAEAYDNAGNMKSDEIINPENINYIHNYQVSKFPQSKYRTSNKLISFIGFTGY